VAASHLIDAELGPSALTPHA